MTRPTARTVLVGVAAAVALAPALPVAPASAAGSTQVVTVAARSGATVLLQGRGFGHGRGMSQWGAYARADAGQSTADILGFYYPGTTLETTLGNPTVRVRLQAEAGQAPTVKAATGLRATTDGCTDTLAQRGAQLWRLTASGSGWKVQYFPYTVPSGEFTTNVWTDWAAGTCAPTFATTGTVGFSTATTPADSVLDLSSRTGQTRRYAGDLRATRNPTLTSQLETVNALPMDTYLRSVVPAEMPASWSPAAVRAQSVAARTYAAARLGASSPWDICDTTACQYYPGLWSTNTPVDSRSTAAVTATTGQVLTYGGRPVTAEFGSTNGGRTAAGPLAYQRSVDDPYDGVFPAAPDTWTYAMPATAVQAAYPTTGTLRSLTLTRDGNGRYAGGRLTSVTVTGSTGSVTVSGESFRAALNLRSTWFAVGGASVGSDLGGDGFADLLARDGAGVLWLYHGDGAAGWARGRTEVGPGWAGQRRIVAPGDLDGDGFDDIVSVTSPGALVLWPGNGQGGIGAARVVGSGWASMTDLVGAGDLDGDGLDDLLARTPTGVLRLYPGDGTGGWKRAKDVGSGWASLRELVAVGDFDGDGGQDLMAKNASGTLYLLRFSRTGTYLGYAVVGSGFGPYSAFTGMGDVDEDGAVDLVVRDTAGALWSYAGTGTGRFLPGRTRLGTGWNGFTITS